MNQSIPFSTSTLSVENKLDRLGSSLSQQIALLNRKFDVREVLELVGKNEQVCLTLSTDTSLTGQILLSRANYIVFLPFDTHLQPRPPLLILTSQIVSVSFPAGLTQTQLLDRIAEHERSPTFKEMIAPLKEGASKMFKKLLADSKHSPLE